MSRVQICRVSSLLPDKETDADSVPYSYELQPKRSGLSSGSLKFSNAVSILSSSTPSRACSGSRRRHRILHPVHFYFRHHVFCVVPAAEEAATGTATSDFRLENRRPGGDKRRHPRVDREREGDNRDVEGGR